MVECASCCAPIKQTQQSVPCSRCGSEIHKKCATVKCSCGAILCDSCFMQYEQCEECESKSKVELEVVRRSHIELYERCPYAFELEVIQGLGHCQTIYTQSGIDLHEMFDEYSKHTDGTPAQMYDEFIERYEKDYPPEWYEGKWTGYRKMHDRYKRNIEGFFKLRDKIGMPVITEEKVVWSVGENLPNVSITMDRIDEEDGEYVLGDYKTGKVMVGKKLQTDLQAPLYILAVIQHYGKPVKRFDFYYLGEEKQRSFIRDENDHDKYICTVNKRQYIVSLSETLKEVRTRLDKIQKGLFTIKPEQKQYNCRQCQFFETHCEGVDTQIWSQVNKQRGY